MSSLKEAYFPPTSVSVWDAREEGVKHPQWTAWNALLFLFRVLQIATLRRGVRKWAKDRRGVEYASCPQ